MIYQINNSDDKLLLKMSNKEQIQNSFEKNPFFSCLVYVDKSYIVGFLSYENIFDRFEIDDLFVDEAYRGNKIATKLLNELVEIGKKLNIKNITLEVRENNYIAIDLYKKIGFINKAIRKNYYGEFDALLMEKEMM